jgi:hypothetical protein
LIWRFARRGRRQECRRSLGCRTFGAGFAKQDEEFGFAAGGGFGVLVDAEEMGVGVGEGLDFWAGEFVAVGELAEGAAAAVTAEFAQDAVEHLVGGGVGVGFGGVLGSEPAQEEDGGGGD